MMLTPKFQATTTASHVTLTMKKSNTSLGAKMAHTCDTSRHTNL